VVGPARRGVRVTIATLVAVNVALLAVGHVAAPSRGDSAGGRQIGLVFDIGGKHDGSFNEAAWRGVQRAERELGVSRPRHRAVRRRRPRERAAGPGRGWRRAGDRRGVRVRSRPRAAGDPVPGGQVRRHRLRAEPWRHAAAQPAGPALPRARGQLRRRRHRRSAVAHRRGRLRRRHADPADPQVRGRLPGRGAADLSALPGAIGLCRHRAEGVRRSAARPGAGRRAVRAGADIIFHAAGKTGDGVFAAARTRRALGHRRRLRPVRGGAVLRGDVDDQARRRRGGRRRSARCIAGGTFAAGWSSSVWPRAGSTSSPTSATGRCCRTWWSRARVRLEPTTSSPAASWCPTDERAGHPPRPPRAPAATRASTLAIDARVDALRGCRLARPRCRSGPGTFHAVVGENGAGKSTLLQDRVRPGPRRRWHAGARRAPRSASARTTCRPRPRPRPRHGPAARRAGARPQRGRERGARARANARRCAGARRAHAGAAPPRARAARLRQAGDEIGLPVDPLASTWRSAAQRQRAELVATVAGGALGGDPRRAHRGAGAERGRRRCWPPCAACGARPHRGAGDPQARRGGRRRRRRHRAARRETVATFAAAMARSTCRAARPRHVGGEAAAPADGSRRRRRPARAARPALVLRGLSVGSRPAPEVDVAVGAGELVGVAGVDGNGQEELVAALAGLVRAAGRVELLVGR
jgi:hypothetical protein